MRRERASAAVLWLFPLPHTLHTPKTATHTNVNSVSKLRGSISEVIRGVPPNLQSTLRFHGLSSNQELTNVR